MKAEDLRERMRYHVDAGHVPGMVVATGTSEATVFLEAYGCSQIVPTVEPMRTSTVFDLASLTKPVATATMTALLHQEGLLTAETIVGECLPESVGDPKADITIDMLLRHTSGLPAWRALYAEGWNRETAVRALMAQELVRPRGAEREYSCLGFILLGLVVERLGGATLEDLTRARIFRPLAMHETTFRPLPALAARCAATEIRGGLTEPCRGTVHDENADAMGGVSGNAGLFSTASDLCRFARMMLRGGELEGVRILTDSGMGSLLEREPSSPSGPHWRGWVGVDQEDAVGRILSPRAFGHTGYTGTSLWCDPELDMSVVCLTNAVHPKRTCLEHIADVRLSVYRAARALVRG